MAAPSSVPALRPEAGFVIKTEEEKPRPGFAKATCWYVNFTKHPLVGMPLTPNGLPTDKEHLLSRGLGNLKVPLDLGSVRKIKEASEGSRRITYCIDVVFNPFMITLFMDDAFCKAMEDYRPYVIGLAFSNINRELRRKLSQEKVTLVKSMFYKDGLGKRGDAPREFADLPSGIADEDASSAQGDVKFKMEGEASDTGFTLKTSKAAEPADGKPLIEECTSSSAKPPERKKGPVVKKGFLNDTKAAGKLYGEEGSTEGVLPENAGDPLGYLPKGLRNTCKVVDCNAPEYQAHEQKRKAAEEHNQRNNEFQSMLTKDMEKWTKSAARDKWQEDCPIADDEPRNSKARYDNDYSRFANLEEEPDAPAMAESRDWYFDEKGNRCSISGAAGASGGGYNATSAPVESSPARTGKPAVKKGFLKDTKGSIYGEEGSSQGGAGMDQEKQQKMIEELGRSILSGDGEEAKQLAAILGGDGKDAAAKMAEMVTQGRDQKRESSSFAGEEKAREEAAKGSSSDTMKLFAEMMKGFGGGENDQEEFGKMLGPMMEKLKGKDPKDMEATMNAVREMVEGLSSSGGARDKLLGTDHVDTPDRGEFNASKQLGQQGQVSRPSSRSTQHRIERSEEEGLLRLVVEVPGLSSMQGVGLDVAESFASINFPKDTGLEALRTDLPASVVPQAAKAKFSKKTKTLTVTMPLSSTRGS